MSKKKPPAEQSEDDFYDQMIFDDHDHDHEDEMINTFGQVAEASVEHMKVACELTRIIIEHKKDEKLSADAILEVFRKASDTILDCTPLKALFDRA